MLTLGLGGGAHPAAAEIGCSAVAERYPMLDGSGYEGFTVETAASGARHD